MIDKCPSSFSAYLSSMGYEDNPRIVDILETDATIVTVDSMDRDYVIAWMDWQLQLRVRLRYMVWSCRSAREAEWLKQTFAYGPSISIFSDQIFRKTLRVTRYGCNFAHDLGSAMSIMPVNKLNSHGRVTAHIVLDRISKKLRAKLLVKLLHTLIDTANAKMIIIE